MAGSSAERGRDRGARDLRRRAARAHPYQLRQGRAPSHHAAQSAAGRKVQLCAETAGDEPVSRAIGSSERPAICRPARGDASDLAGIGVSVLPYARTRCARADRGALTTGNRADHRGYPCARNGDQCAHHARLQFDLRDRPPRIDPFRLRQGPSGAIRRILAIPGVARAARPDATHQGPRRIHPRRAASHSAGAGGAEFSAAGLLRNHFSRQCAATQRAEGLALPPRRPLFRLAVRGRKWGTARLAPQPDQ